MNVENLEIWSAVYAAGAARELGLLAVLADGDASAQEVADRCNIDVRGCQVILDVLASHGYIEALPGQLFRVAGELAKFGQAFQGLADRLRGGAPKVGYDQIAGAASNYPELVAGLGRIYGDLPQRMAAELPATKVLDMGAGSGVWSSAIAKAHANCQVTALDLPQVLVTTRGCVAEQGLSDRYDFLAGDFFEIPLEPATYDLVVVAQVFHLFGEAKIRQLLARAYATLMPGGQIAIIDQLRGDMARSKCLSGRELSLFARTSEGRLHAFSSYAGWLREAGFSQCRRAYSCETSGHALVVAARE